MRFLASRPSCTEDAHAPSSACVYQVAWSINPHMVVGSVNPRRARSQHAGLICAVRDLGARVHTVPFVHGAFDSVFAKDNALYARRAGMTHALFAEPRYPERQAEQTARGQDLRRAGIAIDPHTAPFEGGDVIVVPGRYAFLGYGFRSAPGAARVIERFLGLPVIPLELVDPALYHLDTALAVLADGTALACEDALSPRARETLRRTCAVIPVSRAEAMRFAVNVVQIGSCVVTGTDSRETTAAFARLGLRTVYTPLDEFHRAGGSVACLLAPVHDQATVAIAATAAMRSTVA